MAKRESDPPGKPVPPNRDIAESELASPVDSDSELLAAAREAFAASETSLTGGESSVMPIPPAVSHPDRIGRYRIVSVLGQGGMGIVYEAEQQNPRRPVALKVVRGGRFVDEHHIRLFQREAQTLARLRHPGIAAIHEAGRTEDGRHFFAMELVRGLPLNRYASERTLPLVLRLKLFRKICDAINYAHQRGVIHRDLKPSNIIIDANDNPKILDFGLAKITDSDVSTATVVTQLGSLQGTLAYMSPEQARGNPDEIDLRSDVYALGVILYELATDQLPLPVEGSALHEAVRSICEDAPPKPSRIKTDIPSDLETIILKALAKEPSRRYHSAATLSDDVERFLTNQAILARPPSTVYQLRKLIARNKAPFVLVALLFAVVVAFGLWNRSLFRAEQTARQVAVENAEAANEVSSFLVDLFKRADPNVESADSLTVRRILDRGAVRIRTDLKERPAIQATMMVTMSTAYRNLGLYQPATELLEDALATRLRIHDSEDLAIAECQLNLAWILKDRGLYSEAESRAREALRIRRKHLGDEDVTVAWGKAVLGAIMFSQGRLMEAERWLREATTTQRRVLGLHDVNFWIVYGKLGDVLRDQGRLSEAEAIARETLAMRRSILPEAHPHIASAHSSLAAVLLAKGAYDEAEVEIRKAIAIRREKLTAEHQYSASANVWLGRILRAQGRYDEAVAVSRLAVEGYKNRLNKNHPNIAISLTALAWALFDNAAYDKAENNFIEALRIIRSQQPVSPPDEPGSPVDKPASPDLCSPLLGYGRTLIATGRAADAEPLLREAMDILTAPPPPGMKNARAPHQWMRARTQTALGHCLTKLGEFDRAERLLLQGYAEAKAIRGRSDPYVREARRRVLALYEAWGKPERAARHRED